MFVWKLDILLIYDKVMTFVFVEEPIYFLP